MERNNQQLYLLSRDKYENLIEDLIITGSHSILVDDIRDDQHLIMCGPEKRLYVTEDKIRLFVYLDSNAEPYSQKGIFTIYHLALENEFYDNNYGIYANGLLVESCSEKCLKEYSKMELI
jgi:hypothetical protein